MQDISLPRSRRSSCSRRTCSSKTWLSRASKKRDVLSPRPICARDWRRITTTPSGHSGSGTTSGSIPHFVAGTSNRVSPRSCARRLLSRDTKTSTARWSSSIGSHVECATRRCSNSGSAGTHRIVTSPTGCCRPYSNFSSHIHRPAAGSSNQIQSSREHVRAHMQDTRDIATLARTFDPARLPAEFYEDPYPVYEALREYAPLHRCPDGTWFLTKYADLDRIYRARDFVSSDKRHVFADKYGPDSALFAHHTT